MGATKYYIGIFFFYY